MARPMDSSGLGRGGARTVAAKRRKAVRQWCANSNRRSPRVPPAQLIEAIPQCYTCSPATLRPLRSMQQGIAHGQNSVAESTVHEYSQYQTVGTAVLGRTALSAPIVASPFVSPWNDASTYRSEDATSVASATKRSPGASCTTGRSPTLPKCAMASAETSTKFEAHRPFRSRICTLGFQNKSHWL